MAESLYIKEAEVAALLKHNITWLKTNINVLEREHGFPAIDPAIGHRHRGAIEAWALERNMRSRTKPKLSETNVEKFDEF